MSWLILNDVHLGVQRVAGTTPASASAVRRYLQESFRNLVMKHTNQNLIILGDLFDGFSVEPQEVLDAWLTLSAWLNESEECIVLVAGNHDIGKRNDRLSSFGLLSSLLSSQYGGRVKVVDSDLWTYPGLHFIPHCMNQDLFDIELEKALDKEPGFLFLHANVDNGFTEEADHSLNVSGEWLEKLSKIHHLVFAHEHQHRTFTVGYKPITVLGNQWPSSVADCLSHGEAQKDGVKYAHTLKDGELIPSPMWSKGEDYAELDWNDLRDVSAKFVRIVGEASAEQAAEVVSAIARYRMKSDAFVVGNGVKIAGATGLDEMTALNFEAVTSFDVLGALLEHLEPDEASAVKELLP